MDEQRETRALTEAAGRLGRDDEATRALLRQLWESAYQNGRLDAAHELQDRLCVCTG
jgi:hypothetical protein